MQSNRELYEKKSETIQKAIEEAEAQGKAANDAILERQAEMKQLQEQYAEKENEATSSRAASVPAESPRLSADLASGMDPRLQKKEKSRHRAEQHRVASAQGRIESWRDYEANYPEELDYYEIARAKGTGRLQAWDDGAEKVEKPKEKEPKIEDLSTQELAEMKRERQLYKPSSPQRTNSKIYKTASGETVKDLGKINAKVTIGIGNGALTVQLSSDGSPKAITFCRSPC
eukprot:g11430.t1